MKINKLLSGLVIAGATAALMSCADAGSTGGSPNSGLGTNPPATGEPPGENPPAAQSMCSPEGTFERCTPDGLLGSTREIVSIENNQISQTVETYLLSANCEGIPALINPILSTLQLGELGQSESIAGATDLDLNSSVDLGCGLGLPVFSTIHISDDCGQIAFSSDPGCDPADRGVALDLNVFDRQ